MEEPEVDNPTPIIELRKEDCFTHEGEEYMVLTRYLIKDGCLKAVNLFSKEVPFYDPNLMVNKY